MSHLPLARMEGEVLEKLGVHGTPAMEVRLILQQSSGKPFRLTRRVDILEAEIGNQALLDLRMRHEYPKMAGALFQLMVNGGAGEPGTSNFKPIAGLIGVPDGA